MIMKRRELIRELRIALNQAENPNNETVYIDVGSLNSIEITLEDD